MYGAKQRREKSVRNQKVPDPQRVFDARLRVMNWRNFSSPTSWCASTSLTAQVNTVNRLTVVECETSGSGNRSKPVVDGKSTFENEEAFKVEIYPFPSMHHRFIHFMTQLPLLHVMCSARRTCTLGKGREWKEIESWVLLVTIHFRKLLPLRYSAFVRNITLAHSSDMNTSCETGCSIQRAFEAPQKAFESALNPFQILSSWDSRNFQSLETQSLLRRRRSSIRSSLSTLILSQNLFVSLIESKLRADRLKASSAS